MRIWKIFLLCSGVFVLAFFLRVYNLTIVPVFADEAIYIRWAQVMRAVPELRFMPLSDGKQPLFMWSVIPFFKIFSDPLFAGRFLSVLCGVWTTVGVGILTWILFPNSKFEYRNPKQIPNSNDKNSKRLKHLDIGKLDIVSKLGFSASDFILPLLAMFFYAISPFAVFFDRLALADAMLSMFGIWTFIFAILAVRYQRLDCAMIAGFFLGGAALTKSPSLYFQLLLPTTLLLIDWHNTKKQKIVTFLKTSCLLLVAYCLSLGFYNILRLGGEFHKLSSRNLDYVYPLSHLFERPLDPLKPFLMEVGRWLWIMGPSVLVILVVVGILFNLKRYPRQIVFLTTLSILPILVSAEFAKVFTARYIFFSIPYLMILAALSISKAYIFDIEIATRSGYRMLAMTRVLLCIITIFIAHSLIIDYWYLTSPQKAPIPRSERSGYLEEWTAGYGINEINVFLRKEREREPNKKIVVGTEGYFGTLPDGLQMYLNDRPEITIIGVGQPVRNVNESLLESKKAGNKTYLVVNSTRFLGDADKLGLKLLESYPKAERPDGTQEELLFFELQ